MTELAPTRTDPALAAGSEVLGGPAGDHRAPHQGWWTPVRVILIVGTVTFLLGLLRTVPCMANNWASPERYQAMCYSDIPVLYHLRGIADGLVPYLEWPQWDQPLEYPVLIGAVMWLTGKVTLLVTGGTPDAVVYYLVTSLVTLAAILFTLVATARTVRGRTWDALLVAASPVVLLASFINWDWLAVAATAGFFWAWSARRPVWAGIALGLAVAAKLYAFVLLGPLLLLTLRARKLPAFAVTTTAAAVTWLVLNVPVMLANFEGWKRFFTFSAERGQDFGSIWQSLDIMGAGVPAGALNALAMGLLLVLCAGIGVIIVAAPRRPRLAQVSFLVVAAFVVTNKVYSPQFMLWLLPLAVLARPRWRDLLWWQAGQAVYFAAIWWYLVTLEHGKGLSEQWYAAAIWVHAGVTLLFAALVIRDIWRPEHDPVRGSGDPRHIDDPGGGVLDGAGDWGRPPAVVPAR